MKRISALLLVLALVLSMSVTAFAAEADTNTASLTADAQRVSGLSVIRVSMAGGEGVTNGIVTVSYDPELVRLVGWTLPEIYGAASVNDQVEGTVSLAWVGSDLTGEATELIALRFETVGGDSEEALYEVIADEVYAGAEQVTVEGTAIGFACNPFIDIDGHWAKEEILAAYEAGLVNGIGNRLYDPDGLTNRAMFVTVLYRMAGSPDVAGLTTGFADVEKDSYYEDAVIWASNMGVVNGVSATAFAPMKDLSREEMATMLYRYAKFCGEDMSARGDLSAYSDAGDVSGWAVEAMVWATGEAILNGFHDGTVQPQGNATRAQLAAVLCRYLGLEY